MTEPFIKDDTETNLSDRLSFPSVTTESEESQSDSFASDVEEYENDQRPLSQNPYVRIGLAVAAGSFVIGFGSIFFGNKEQAVVESTDGTEETAELSMTLDETEAASSDPDGEIDTLRSQVALLEQQIALGQIDRTQNPETTPATTRQPKPTTSTSSPQAVRSSPTSTPTPVRPTPAPPPPRPVSVTRVSQAPRPAPRPAAATPSRVVTPSTPAPTASSSFRQPEPYTPPDPNEQWALVANAGVMGTMPELDVASNTQLPQEALTASTTPAVDTQYQLKNASYEEPQQAQEKSAEPVPGLIYEYEDSGYIPLGTSAGGRVSTPITWTGNSEQFLIEVTQDIESSNGTIAAPAGSYLVVQPVSVNDSSGLAELAVVGISINGQTTALDYTTVSVKGKGGNPLVAEKYNMSGSQVAGNDLEMVLIGALSGVARELTQPQSQITTNTAFGSSQSTDNGDSNIVGGILAGGTEELAGRMSDRNQQRLDDIQSRESIWYLPEGADVEIFFNQDVSI